jgi:hypothetical protein
MSLHFQRKIGAAADVKELEYIIALHQTIPRETATISSIDVHRFLHSRYALSPKAVSQSQLAELLSSLGGCDDLRLTTIGPERIQQSQLQSSILLSPNDLPASSSQVANDNGSFNEEKEIIVDLSGDDIIGEDEKHETNQIETNSDEVANCQRDYLMNEPTTKQTVDQKYQPNFSHCQLE